MIQCMLCGCKFDETKLGPCTCECAFGGCGGANVRCPNCGMEIVLPKDKRPKTSDQNKSFLSKLKSLI